MNASATCPQCGHGNPAAQKFCGECGARLSGRCASCGAENPPRQKFCGECGAALAAASDEPRFRSPQAYTPKHLAERILISKAAVEGERKHVTVLLADLKGSTELLADRDPEEARKILDPVVERMMEAVHRYEGTVNQVMGDGVMALFGAPLAHEDHAVRACYAALRMQEQIRAYSEILRRTHGVEVQIRVGINSGDVVVRSVGSDLRMDYTAVGQTTHLAGRMEQLALPGTTRLTAATLRLAEEFVQVRALGPTPVKGLSAPLDVFELIGAATVRTRLQAARARGFSRFVGRDIEMDQLHEAAVRARQGRGQLVAIVGDAGVGKSRLLYEFIHSHHVAGSGERGWRVLEARSLAYGVGTPFLPLAELLRGYFGLDERDDARGVRAKVTGTLFTLDRALEDLVAPLLWILDALDAVDPFLALEPAQRRRRAVESVKRALLRESHAQPLLLVFEDLQWADTETQAVLDSLVESLATSPILLTVNYRPEYRHGWGGKSFYRQLHIDPLPPARADELLRALLGRDPSTAALVPLLITRTEGNPLFLEESVRTLAETGALAGEPGAYRLARPADTIRMPSTVQAILEARIDRLRPELKRLLQAAAVVGKDVPLPLLAAVAEMPEDELAPALRELQGAEFLYEARLFPDVEYTFKHALTHEVAYESVLHERRRALHATILGALERLHAGRAGEHVEMLAHHAVRGGLAAKAIGYLREAGARAVARSANREAIGFLNQALALVGDAPRTRETLSQALDIRIALGPPLIAVHGPRSAIVEETYLAARELVDPLDDPVRRFIVLWGLWFVRFTRGDYAPAVESGERLIEIARAGDDSGRLIEAHHTLWPTLFAMGRAREALAHAERGVALYDRERHADLVSQYAGHDSGVCCRYYRAASLWVLGYPDRALTGVYEATSLAESLKHVLTAAMSLWFAGLILYERGDRRAAVATVQRAQALMSADPFPAWSADFDVLLDAAHETRPDIARLEVLYDRLQRMGSTSFRQAIGVCLLAQRAAQAGAPERGLAMLAALDRPERESLYEPEVSRTEGELLRLQRPDATGAAERRFTSALEVARRRELKMLELRAAISLARLWRDAGRVADALPLLAEVHGRFDEGFDTHDLRAARALLDELRKTAGRPV